MYVRNISLEVSQFQEIYINFHHLADLELSSVLIFSEPYKWHIESSGLINIFEKILCYYDFLINQINN